MFSHFKLTVTYSINNFKIVSVKGNARLGKRILMFCKKKIEVQVILMLAGIKVWINPRINMRLSDLRICLVLKHFRKAILHRLIFWLTFKTEHTLYFLKESELWTVNKCARYAVVSLEIFWFKISGRGV